MNSLRSYLHSLPVRERFTFAFTALFAGAGALVGLVRGLEVYPPTAAFAVFEVGVPAALVGAVLGSASGTVALAVRKRRQGADGLD